MKKINLMVVVVLSSFTVIGFAAPITSSDTNASGRTAGGSTSISPGATATSVNSATANDTYNDGTQFTTRPNTYSDGTPFTTQTNTYNDGSPLNAEQRRTKNSFQTTETCLETDAACLRRKQGQLQQTTPFEQRVPPVPSVVTPPTQDTNIRR